MHFDSFYEDLGYKPLIVPSPATQVVEDSIPSQAADRTQTESTTLSHDLLVQQESTIGTVIMESAADADACATGLFVAGSEDIRAWEPDPWLPALVMVRQAGRQDAVEVESLGDVPWVEEQPQ